MKFLFVTLLLGSLLLVNCTKQAMSNLEYVPRERGFISLKTSSNPHIRHGEANYTIYLSGLIQYQGDVSYVLPGTQIELTHEFQKQFFINPDFVQSTIFRQTQVKKFQTGRMEIQIVDQDFTKNEVKVRIILNRTTHWTDIFWGFQEVFVVLDVTKELITFKSFNVVNGTTFYDKEYQDTVPSSYDEEHDKFAPQYYQRGINLFLTGVPNP